MSPDHDPRVPVTLLSGFLGSGKTTLLNRILSEDHGVRCAVVVNEFGETPIDGQLVVGARDELVELANGCLCCTVRGDLLDTLAALVRGRNNRMLPTTRFDRILVEASGLASPGPAAATVHLPELVGDLRFDGTVTLAHAAEIAAQVEEFPEAGEQLAYADFLLLNHRDRCDERALERATAAVRACNADAPLEVTERAQVDVAKLLELGGGRAADRAEGAPADEHAPHAHGMVSMTLESRAPLRMEELKYWIGFLGERRGQDLMRMKGLLRCTDKEHPVVVQVVGRWLEIGPDPRLEMPEVSRMVVIGRHLDRDELRRGWEACGAEGGAPV